MEWNGGAHQRKRITIRNVIDFVIRLKDILGWDSSNLIILIRLYRVRFMTIHYILSGALVECIVVRVVKELKNLRLQFILGLGAA